METTELLQNHSEIDSLSLDHIFSKHFGSLFVHDSIEPEIIENLQASRGSSDEGHEQYVAELMKVWIFSIRVLMNK